MYVWHETLPGIVNTEHPIIYQTSWVKQKTHTKGFNFKSGELHEYAYKRKMVNESNAWKKKKEKIIYLEGNRLLNPRRKKHEILQLSAEKKRADYAPTSIFPQKNKWKVSETCKRSTIYIEIIKGQINHTIQYCLFSSILFILFRIQLFYIF